MEKALLCSLALLFVVSTALSQGESQVFDGSVVMMSSAVVIPKPERRSPGSKTVTPVYMTQQTYDSFRFDLVNLTNGCRETLCIVYGSRFGNNWDIFNIGGGATSQTRMVRIGKYNWTDNFKVPNVEPWPELKPGEKRTVSFNTSGGDGADGGDGSSGRGSAQDIRSGDLSAVGSMQNQGYANAHLDRQVSSAVKTADGKTRKDNYSPVLEAKLGYMYVVRVKDPIRDYYVLVRVDELKRGERMVISYKKMEIPKSVL